jgi:fatty acid desaturase
MPTAQAEFASLKRTIHELHLDRRPTTRFLIQWFASLAIGFGALAAFIHLDNPWLRAPVLLLSCFGFLGVATAAHTASHEAASEKRWLNTLVYYVSYPLVLMISARYWHKSHVQTHHVHPNTVGVDPDCDLAPWFALNQRDAQSASSFRRAYYRVQWLLLPLVLPLNGFNMQRQSWLHVVSELRDPRRRALATYADLAGMLLHVVGWLVLPCLFFPVAQVFLVYILRMAVMGVGLFAILAPGHYPAEAVYLLPGERRDFWTRQAIATVNFRTGLLGHWLCSGLEYQLEHHLFPHISHVHYARLSPLVRDFCSRTGLPYREMSWGEAIWRSYQTFISPKPVFETVEATRMSRPYERPTEADEEGPALAVAPSLEG